jgi:hypothetical protein
MGGKSDLFDSHLADVGGKSPIGKMSQLIPSGDEFGESRYDAE